MTSQEHPKIVRITHEGRSIVFDREAMTVTTATYLYSNPFHDPLTQRQVDGIDPKPFITPAEFAHLQLENYTRIQETPVNSRKKIFLLSVPIARGQSVGPHIGSVDVAWENPVRIFNRGLITLSDDGSSLVVKRKDRDFVVSSIYANPQIQVTRVPGYAKLVLTKLDEQLRDDNIESVKMGDFPACLIYFRRPIKSLFAVAALDMDTTCTILELHFEVFPREIMRFDRETSRLQFGTHFQQKEGRPLPMIDDVSIYHVSDPDNASKKRKLDDMKEADLPPVISFDRLQMGPSFRDFIMSQLDIQAYAGNIARFQVSKSSPQKLVINFHRQWELSRVTKGHRFSAWITRMAFNASES